MQLPGTYACAGWALVLGLFGPMAQAKWALTQRPADERARTCQEQVSFCYNACGSVAATTTNFCNIRTMGWNCACAAAAAEGRIRRYEWPVAIAECRAALAMCSDGCMAQENGSGRLACFATCATDYPCNTPSSPASSLRVQAASEQPAGYIPPVDDRDIELPIGMKLGAGAPGQAASDPGVLPRIVPRDVEPRVGSAPRGARPGARKQAGAGERASASSASPQRMRRAAATAAAAALLMALV